MNKLIALGLTVLSTLAVLPTAAYAESTTVGVEAVNRRTNLRRAINRMRGQMTEHEFRALSRSQTQLEVLRTNARSDGQIGPDEARAISRATDAQARRIADFRSTFNARNTQQIP